MAVKKARNPGTQAEFDKAQAEYLKALYESPRDEAKCLRLAERLYEIAKGTRLEARQKQVAERHKKRVNPKTSGIHALRAKLIKALDAAQDGGRISDAQADKLFQLILKGWPMITDAKNRKQQEARKRAVEAFRRQGLLRKNNPAKKRNTKTVIKAKRVTILNLTKKKNPPRKANITSASDLQYAGTAKSATRDGVKGWQLGSKFFPRSAQTKAEKITASAYLDLRTGDVWKRKAKNPKRRNVQQGFYDGNGVFHPIRASADYDGRTAGETGGKPRHTRSKKKKTASRKASQTARDRAAKRAASKTKTRLASRALQRSVPLKGKRRNVAQGFYDGNGVFHPIRASHDYDGKTAGETGGKPRRTRSKKRAASARKASQTARSRAVTKQRKATTSRLASRSLQRSVPLKKKRRNPIYDYASIVANARRVAGLIPATKASKLRKAAARLEAIDRQIDTNLYTPDKSLLSRLYSRADRIAKPLIAATNHEDGRQALGAYRKKARRNPDTPAQLLEQFRGYPKDKDSTLYFAEGTPTGLYKLGSLYQIKLVNGTKIKPVSGKVWLCADTKGKLYLGTTDSKQVLANAPQGSLGKVAQVEYVARKPHLGDNKVTRYYHNLGEETGEKPTLYSDGKGGLLFKGGATYVTREGIRN